jgi:CrcB protein
VDHASAPSGKLARMRRRLVCAVFLGGAAGGLVRAALERAWPADGRSWPWVTFVVNVAGTALLAWVVGHLGHRRYARPLIGVGFCGALTTFSTLQLDALELAHHHHAVLALLYVAGSIAAGLLAATIVGGLGRPTAAP